MEEAIMGEKVSDTIKRISREHLTKHNGLILGQCLTAVGWVGGTVPEMKEEEGIVELSMSDVLNGYFVTGIARAGRRPIYVVRYQGFQWFNSIGLINYAAKSKDLWEAPCPTFIRSIAMDGGIGPVASGTHHGIYARMPGIPIAAPMTSKEYESVWDFFMNHDDVVLCSEHRRSFGIDYEFEDTIKNDADITLLPISSTRLNAIEAVKNLEKEGITCNINNVLWLKPFNPSDKMIYSVNNSKYGGLFLDGEHENGLAKCLAFDLMHKIEKKIHVLGLEERTAGFSPHLDNLPPSAGKIEKKVKEIMSKG